MTNSSDDPKESASRDWPKAPPATPLWMRSIPEPISPEEVESRKAWIAALYPDEVVQEIVGKSHLNAKQDLADTREFLFKAAYWYFDRKHGRHPGASYSADRAQLTSIAKSASILARQLQGLSEVSADMLWHPFKHSWSFNNPSIAHGNKTPFGLTIKKYKEADGSIAVHHLKPPDIEEALEVLNNLAKAASEALPAQKGGQPQDPNRLSWMCSAAIFWREHSSIAFGHRSIAFEFCNLGFRRLDPNVSSEQIGSAMRAAAKEVAKAKIKTGQPETVQEPK